MKLRLISYGTVAILTCLALAAPAGAQLVSSFSEDVEGWQAKDLSCSNYTQVVATHALAWVGAGGDPNGYASHHDVSNQCAFFVAPAGWLGDRSATIGGRLDFALTSTEFDWSGSDVVVLVGAGLVLCHELPQLPPQPPLWGRYSVPLEAARFRYNSATGAVASEPDFAAVMADLDALYLPAEFGAQIEETVGLDSVRLFLPASAVPEVPAPAARLVGAQPNPFNPSTLVVFELDAEAPVRLTVHDAAGRLVAVLRDGETGQAGRNEVAWRGLDTAGRALPSGTYLARLEAGGALSTTRLTLLR